MSEGARIASIDSEIIAYAVLDLLAKPVFGFWLLLTHDKNLTGSTVTLDGFWSEGLPVHGAIRVCLSALSTAYRRYAHSYNNRSARGELTTRSKQHPYPQPWFRGLVILMVLRQTSPE